MAGTVIPDLSGQTALVTGGTRGLGRAIGLRLGRAGAHVWLTHRWGSADEGALRAAFADVGAPTPRIVASDAGRAEDREALIDQVFGAHGHLDVLVSNVCVVGRGGSLDRLDLRSLRRSLAYSARPLEHLVELCAARGALPRRVVATSSDGVDHVYPAYDYVACAKAVLEQLVRELAERHGCAATSLRTRLVLTEGFEEVFGPELVRVLSAFPELQISPEEVADVALALCGEGLRGLAGGMIRVDRGASLIDNIARSGPELVRRLAAPASPSVHAPTPATVELVGDAPWTEALRAGVAEARALRLAPDADAVVVSVPEGTTDDVAERVWPAVAALRDHPRDAVVVVHRGGVGGALARTLVQHLSAHLPDTRVNAVRAADPVTTAGAVLTLLGPLLRAVRGQQLELREAA